MVLLNCNTKTAQRSPESRRGWIPPLRPGVSIGARGSEGTMLSWDPPDPHPSARQDGLGCCSHQIWRNPDIAPAILPPFHIVPIETLSPRAAVSVKEGDVCPLWGWRRLGSPSTGAWLAQVPAMQFQTEQSGQGCILGQKVEIFEVVKLSSKRSWLVGAGVAG